MSISAACVVAYSILNMSLWVIERNVRAPAGEISNLPEFRTLRACILGAAAGCYALFRLWRFHPICNSRYAAWLANSPWTSAKALPLGPAHPVWPDAIVIGIITAVAQWHAHIDPTIPYYHIRTDLPARYDTSACGRTHMDACPVIGISLAGDDYSCDARTRANTRDHRRADRGHLVRVPQKLESISMES